MVWAYGTGPLPRSRYMVAAELERLLAAVETVTLPETRSKFRCLFLILVNSGPRISEALAVRARDVDLVSGTITFPTLKRLKPTTRTLPLPAEILRELELYLQVNAFRPEDRIFPRTRGKYVWEVLKRALHEAGLPRHYRLHDLRHSAGTYLADKTRDPMLVRDVLGHASLLTSNIYLHTVHMREKLQAVPPVLPATPTPGEAPRGGPPAARYPSRPERPSGAAAPDPTSGESSAPPDPQWPGKSGQ